MFARITMLIASAMVALTASGSASTADVTLPPDETTIVSASDVSSRTEAACTEQPSRARAFAELDARIEGLERWLDARATASQRDSYGIVRSGFSQFAAPCASWPLTPENRPQSEMLERIDRVSSIGHFHVAVGTISAPRRYFSVFPLAETTSGAPPILVAEAAEPDSLSARLGVDSDRYAVSATFRWRDDVASALGLHLTRTALVTIFPIVAGEPNHTLVATAFLQPTPERTPTPAPNAVGYAYPVAIAVPRPTPSPPPGLFGARLLPAEPVTYAGTDRTVTIDGSGTTSSTGSTCNAAAAAALDAAVRDARKKLARSAFGPIDAKRPVSIYAPSPRGDPDDCVDGGDPASPSETVSVTLHFTYRASGT